MKFKRAQKGFTLIELMIALAIVSILAAVAYPSYQNSVAKARRAEATGALLEGAQALERYYSVNGRYIDGSGNLPAVFPTQVPANGTAYYTLAATGTPTASSFTLRATRSGVMSGDPCGQFEINHTGTMALNSNASGYSVADCWRR